MNFLAFFGAIAAMSLYLAVSVTSSTLVGGSKQQDDVNQPKFRNLAAHALKHRAQNEGRAYIDGLFEILEVKTQVVSGINYDVKVSISPSKCKTSEHEKYTLESCPPSGGAPSEICHFRIWEQVWLNSTRVTNTTCYAA